MSTTDAVAFLGSIAAIAVPLVSLIWYFMNHRSERKKILQAGAIAAVVIVVLLAGVNAMAPQLVGSLNTSKAASHSTPTTPVSTPTPTVGVPQAPAGYVTFTSDDKAYGFNYPFSWKVDEKVEVDGGTTRTVCNNPGVAEIVDIYITSPAYQVPSEAYNALLTKVWPSYTFGSPVLTTVGSNTWKLSRGFPDDLQSLDTVYAYSITHNGLSYLLLMPIAQRTPSEAQDIYQKILASFTFLN